MYYFMSDLTDDMFSNPSYDVIKATKQAIGEFRNKPAEFAEYATAMRLSMKIKLDILFDKRDLYDVGVLLLKFNNAKNDTLTSRLYKRKDDNNNNNNGLVGLLVLFHLYAKYPIPDDQATQIDDRVCFSHFGLYQNYQFNTTYQQNLTYCIRMQLVYSERRVYQQQANTNTNTKVLFMLNKKIEDLQEQERKLRKQLDAEVAAATPKPAPTPAPGTSASAAAASASSSSYSSSKSNPELILKLTGGLGSAELTSQSTATITNTSTFIAYRQDFTKTKLEVIKQQDYTGPQKTEEYNFAPFLHIHNSMEKHLFNL
jgi:hypothetical protein